VLVVTGFAPLPFFPFKFLGFSVHYPLWRYLAALATGRFPRYVLLAWFGQVIQIPSWVLLAFFVAFIAVAAGKIMPTFVRYVQAGQSKARTQA
jgi:uncharacterized membrane protein YdjX (TVP38/TMEM64 family)